MSQSRIVRYRMDDGAALLAEIWGDDNAGRTVLFAHGGGQTRYSWAKPAHEVAEAGWRAVALDLRGHGESDWSPNGDYENDRFATDIRDVAYELGGYVVGVGASLGGLASIVAQSFKPPPFHALVICDVTPRLESSGLKRIVGFLTKHIEQGFASPEEAVEAISEYRGQPGRKANPKSMERYLRRSPDGRYRWHWDPKFMAGSHEERVQTTMLERVAAAARTITVPTLLVHGKESDLVSDDTAREFLDLVPSARYLDIAGSGHMIVGDRNDAFAAGLLDFLRELRTPEFSR
jgi:pimeloyl-ACP methyl ester carboxylesterase